MAGRLVGIRIALLGGDGREIELLRTLAAEGATVKAIAYPPESLPPGDVEAVADPRRGRWCGHRHCPHEQHRPRWLD